jgi:hypothetical protein
MAEPVYRRSGENATNRSRSSVRPLEDAMSCAYRSRVSPTGSVVSMMTVAPLVTPVDAVIAAASRWR